MREPFKIAIIVNGFFGSPKFSDIYSRLKEAADRRGFLAQIFENTAFVTDCSVLSLASDFDLCIFWDKDIRLAGRLEKAGLKVMNCARAIEVCDDKQLTYDVLKDKGIPMPKTMALPFTYENTGYTRPDFLFDIEEELGIPFVIKENKGSFGAQVYLADSHEKACEIIKGIGGRPALAQEFISEIIANAAVYGADGVTFTAAAKKQLDEIEALGLDKMPVCMAKTQYSLSDDASKLGRPRGFSVTVRELRVSAGAGFIVALTGDILTMPGLPKKPAAEAMDIDESGRITGLF